MDSLAEYAYSHLYQKLRNWLFSRAGKSPYEGHVEPFLVPALNITST